jgi:hypothetical protein
MLRGQTNKKLANDNQAVELAYFWPIIFVFMSLSFILLVTLAKPGMVCSSGKGY